MRPSEYTCIPCQGVISPLSLKKIKSFLEKLQEDWILNDQDHLEKTYFFENFINSINFTNKIFKIAQKKRLHPDLFISWGKYCVEIRTHKANGLTESNFSLTAKIENKAQHLK